jgi:hypothetical protein
MTVREGPPTARIYYSCNKYPTYYIDAPISRWDEGNWDLIIETFLPSSSRDTLFRYVTPGAVRELYSILGLPNYIDSTYESSNTLIIEPQYGYGVSSLRQKRTVAVKNISDTFITKDMFRIKIEANRIDV